MVITYGYRSTPSRLASEIPAGFRGPRSGLLGQALTIHGRASRRRSSPWNGTASRTMGSTMAASSAVTASGIPAHRMPSGPRRDRGQTLIEAIDQEIRVVAGQAHRGLDPERVAVQAALAEEQAPLLAELEQVGRFGRGGLLRPAVADQ